MQHVGKNRSSDKEEQEMGVVSKNGDLDTLVILVWDLE